jgi:hypothetical protein
MTASNKTIEIHCPACRKLFNSEEEMLNHYDAAHQTKGQLEEAGEDVAGAIYVSETSFFGGANFYLILTSSKILGAQANPKINSKLSPFLGNIPSLLIIGRQRANEDTQNQRLTVSMEKTILENDPKNFLLPYSEIAKVELKKHSRFTTGELRITTTDQKHLNFRLVMLPTARDDTFDIYRKLLKSTLPQKLSTNE